MKTTLALALLTACAVQIDTSSWAQGRPQGRPQRPANGPVQPPAPADLDHAPDSAIRQALLDTYDANKNGRLDASERAQIQADIASGKLQAPDMPHHDKGPGAHNPPPEILEKYDVNKDGKLDETERAAVHADRESGKLARPAGGPGRGAHNPPPEILEKYDVNKDGKLDETERAAVHADIESGKLTPPEGHPSRGGAVPPVGGPQGRRSGRR